MLRRLIYFGQSAYLMEGIMRRDKVRILSWISIVFCAVLGIGAVVLLSRWGPGLFDWDSFNYLASARNLAGGKGLVIPVSQTGVKPMVNFPPLFPIVLSFFETAGVDVMAAARGLNAALFGLNLVLFAALVLRVSGSAPLAVFSALLFLLSGDLLAAHAWALAEPLLIFWILAGLLLYLIWHTSQQHIWLALLYAAIGLAVLTKYVGAALAPAMALLFLLGNGTRRSRWLHALGALLAGIVPFLLWSLRNYLIDGSFNGRGFEFVPLTRGNAISAFLTGYSWFVPEPWLFGREKAILIGSILLLAVGVYLFKKKSPWASATYSVLVFSGAFILVYLLVIVAAKMLVDKGIGFQDRMLLPLYPCILLAFVFVIHQSSKEARAWHRVLPRLAAAYLVFALAFGSAATLPGIYNEGLGWNRRRIVSSPALQELQRLSSDPRNLLYSNEIFGMYFHTSQAGERIGGFPPAGEPGDIYLVLFKTRNRDQHPLVTRYAEQLELVTEDEILAIHFLVTE